MKANNSMSMNPDQYGAVVTPLKSRSTRGEKYEEEFKFSRVHVEDGATDALSDRATVKRDGGKIFYMYPDKTPVMIDEDGVHKYKYASEKNAERQAFFVLSMLAAEGYVSNWGKK